MSDQSGDRCLDKDMARISGENASLKQSNSTQIGRSGQTTSEMRLIGQEHLTRRFNKFSMLATCVSLMATWEAFCSTMAAGLIAGGPVSLIYGFILAIFGTMATALSLSECASMFPLAGGQYQFVAELSPLKIRRYLSWFSGWITTFGWQTVAASAPFLAGTMIQGLLILNYPDYSYRRWHGTLLYWAVLLFSLAINVLTARILPIIEYISMMLHIILFFTIFITVLVAAPVKNSAQFVFTEFLNNSGWDNNGVAWCIGMLSASYVLVGYDGATHLSEEMENPALGVPYAMVGSIIVNGLSGFAFVIAILFCIQDITLALQTTTGFPIIEIFYQVTGGNTAAATAMSSAVVLMAILSTIPLVASAARTLWAFSRDSGMPFSTTLSKVDHSHGIPTIAVCVTTVFLALLGLLNIASTTAFTAITSLAVLGLYISYLMPVVLILHRRLTQPELLIYGPFRLGKWGIPVNIASIVYTIFTCTFLLFPPYQPVTALNFNYASVVFSAVLVFCGICWIWYGRKRYDGPVIELLARSTTHETTGTGQGV